MLTFNEETHSYYWDGVKVPGVTSILWSWQQVTIGGTRYHINRYTGTVIQSSVMEEAAAQGKDIHKGCELINQGGIDWASLDPAYVAPMKQYVQWMTDFKPQILFTEAAFYSERYGYAGTIDIISMIGKFLYFIDIKTGASDTVGPQLAAYEHGWKEHNKYIAQTKRAALWIPKDGSKYKFEVLNNAGDWDFVKAALARKNYLKGGKNL